MRVRIRFILYFRGVKESHFAIKIDVDKNGMLCCMSISKKEIVLFSSNSTVNLICAKQILRYRRN